MSISKTSKLFVHLNNRMKVRTVDGREFVGKMLAYDKCLNLVLQDCEEYRTVLIKKKKKKNKNKEEITATNTNNGVKEQKRSLGLVILRGDNVMSLVPDGSFPKSDDRVSSLVKQNASNKVPGGVSVPSINNVISSNIKKNLPGSSGLMGPLPGQL